MPDASTAAQTPLIHLENLSKTFGGVKALKDVRFDVMPGEVLCLAGENGCGKSTLIKIISGVHQPERGATLLFDGQSIAGLDPARARALGIQVIWQDLALFPEMSVAENVAFERNLGRLPKLVNYAAMRTAARRILERLGVSLDLDATVRSLPIAQRQVVAIARALVADARLVFMDEPTASLSQAETDALLVIVRKLSAEGSEYLLRLVSRRDVSGDVELALGHRQGFSIDLAIRVQRHLLEQEDRRRNHVVGQARS